MAKDKITETNDMFGATVKIGDKVMFSSRFELLFGKISSIKDIQAARATHRVNIVSDKYGKYQRNNNEISRSY